MAQAAGECFTSNAFPVIEYKNAGSKRRERRTLCSIHRGNEDSGEERTDGAYSPAFPTFVSTARLAVENPGNVPSVPYAWIAAPIFRQPRSRLRCRKG